MVKQLYSAWNPTTVAATNTRFQSIAVSRTNLQSIETRGDAKFYQAGTLSDLFVRITANTITANTTIRTRKNATTNGNQSVTVGSGATGVFESANTDAVAANDTWAYQVVAGATGTNITVAILSIIFDATAADTAVTNYVHNENAITATSALYFPLTSQFANGDATEANVKIRIRQDGNFNKLRVNVIANSKAGNTPFMFRLNGANTALSVTFGSSATGILEDTADNITVTAGNDVDIAVQATVSGSIQAVYVQVCLQTDGYGFITNCLAATITQAEPLTHYYALGGGLNTGITTESQTQLECRKAFVFSNLTIHAPTNGITGVSEFRLRKNAADCNSLCTIGSSATGYFTDTVNWDSFRDTDLVNFELTTPAVGGAPTITIRSMGVVVETGFINPVVPTETVTITDNRTRVVGKVRALSTQTVSVSENIARIKGKIKSLATETITITGGTLVRRAAKIRALATQTVAVSENRTRLKSSLRALATQTVALSDSVAREVSAGAQEIERALATEAVAVSESLLRVAAKIRSRSGQETITVSENLARLQSLTKTLVTQTVAVSESVVRIKGVPRALATQTVAIAENLARLVTMTRTIQQTVTITDNRARIKGAIRSLATQTVAVAAGNIATQKGKLRTLATETVVLSEARASVKGANRALATQTVTVAGGTLVRLKAVFRALATETVARGETLARIKGANRLVATQTIIVSAGTLARLANKIRTALQSVTISEQLERTIAGANDVVRTITQTIIVTGGTLTRAMTQTRTITDIITVTGPVIRIKGANRSLFVSTTIDDSLTRLKGSVRSIIQSTTIIEDLKRLLSETRAIGQTISIADNVQRFINIVRQDIERVLSEDGIIILETLQVYVVRVSERFRRIRDPSVWKLKSNHPAWLLGSRGMHDHYEEFSP